MIKTIKQLENELVFERQARKLAEDQLKENELEYNRLMNQQLEIFSDLEELIVEKDRMLNELCNKVVDAYFIFDMDGNFQKMNTSAYALFELNKKQKGKNIEKLVLKEDHVKFKNGLKTIREKGVKRKFRFRIHSKNNNYKHLSINAGVMYNEDGEPIGVHGIARDISEELEMRNSLIESESRLDALVNHLDSGVFLENEKREAVIWNKKAFEIFNIPKDYNYKGKDVSGTTDTVKSFFKDPEKFAVRNKEIAENKTLVTGEKVKTANGKYIEFNYIPIYNDAEFKGNLWTFKDVTTRMNRDERLNIEKQKYGRIIENMNMGFIELDTNETITFVNQAILNISGYSKEELIGTKVPDLFPIKEEVSNAKQRIANSNEGESESFEIKVNNKLGEEQIWLVSSSPSYDNNGEIYGGIGVILDITKTKNLELQKQNLVINLEKQRQKYRSIIANMSLGMIEYDPSNAITLVNQSLLDMSGYTEDEVLGKSILEIFQLGKQVEFAKQKIANRRKGISESFEIEVQNKKGEERTWLVSSAPNLDEKGVFTGTIGVILDITDRKNHEILKEELLFKLEKSNNELHEYAHIVSHDLKSPLRSLFALVSWLRDDNTDKLNTASLEHLDLMETTLEKMDQLITDILSYSSLSEDTSENQEVDLNDLMTEIDNMLYVPKHISLQVLNRLPTIKADPTKLQQLFQNLISNAINYSDKPQGYIYLDCEDEGSKYHFSVRDNGIGIETRYFDKIFEVFQSLSDDTDSSGIGLSIVKKIVTLYGGEIWLESEMRVGTTFHFTIKK
ncbi:PAS domain S-box protein [Ulvibacter antarcticus]|uniref:histidine kinase n=1 Tax=Ulvibacter antarcticus TaxID=442714 RepID=A0A3L9Z7Z6_9FLAO|nr:PAS domain S-box protein [Ulvibacter antarcticus]RMA66415.1 PAS domain S-box-containing protein [Ulvibacter antarcticus]